MVQINWTYQAKDDLKNIADYISNDSKHYAKLHITKLKVRTQVLKTHVHIGRIVPEINKVNVRELIEGNFRIVYKVVSKNQIDVLTIHHSSRDMNSRKID